MALVEKLGRCLTHRVSKENEEKKTTSNAKQCEAANSIGTNGPRICRDRVYYFFFVVCLYLSQESEHMRCASLFSMCRRHFEPEAARNLEACSGLCKTHSQLQSRK